MEKRTKILATLGPASHSVEVIEGLIKAGANMFRLNFSHGSHEYHLETLNNIKAAMKNTGKTVGILQDISGPKVRIGDLKESFELFRDDIITFLKNEIVGYKRGYKDYVVSINYPDILDKVKIDGVEYNMYDTILVNGENVVVSNLI